MGFFKKFFSIGSRKSKKRSAVDPCIGSLSPVQGHPQSYQADDTEAAVSLLLRSSSARFAAQPQFGSSSLSPLPHPIDSIIPHPKSSFTTLASVSARSTYSVTVHSRTVHSCTEFPNAYPPVDVGLTPNQSLTDSVRRRSESVPITPRDKNRLLLLHQDPSVASLLNHYDEEGHLSPALFSNTPSPQEQGRIQRRHTGSTLRQLLGHPSSLDLRNSGTEGDISWAEKFLGLALNTLCRLPGTDETLSETDGNSSVSSIGPRTPADTYFTHTRSIDDKSTLSIECDTSATNHHTFSSLEVELSASTDLAHPQAPNSPHGNSITPQRASQIFGFLGEKKACSGPVSRLPQPKTTTPYYRRFSAESTFSDTKHSLLPLPRRSSTHIPKLTPPISQQHFSFGPDASKSLPLSPTVAVLSPSQSEDENCILPSPVISRSRDPCGPCLPTKLPPQQSTGPMSALCDVTGSHPMAEMSLSMQSILGEKSNTGNESIRVATARLHSQIPKLRTASGSSSSSAKSKHELVIDSPRRHPLCLQPGVQVKLKSTEIQLPSDVAPRGKENDMLSRLPQPITPVRPFGLHAHHLCEPPSPASSSELSPVAKQMMANLRQQRMHARQRERQAGRLGSNQSRIRY